MFNEGDIIRLKPESVLVRDHRLVKSKHAYVYTIEHEDGIIDSYSMGIKLVDHDFLVVRKERAVYENMYILKSLTDGTTIRKFCDVFELADECSDFDVGNIDMII